MIASHLSATLALLFINADSTHGTASAAAAIGNDTSQNVGERFSSVAAVNDHVDCVDDEQARDNKLFLRHHSKTGKSKKTSKSSKSRRGKSVKKCPPADIPTPSPSKEPAASTAPPTGAPQAKTATLGPTPAFIEPTLAPSPSKVEALSRLIWADASEDFTFDFFGFQATCNWKEFDACIQHPTFRGGSNEAYDACEKAMLKAFGDPRLTADVEPYLLFNTNLTSGIIPKTMTGCTSLVSASREIYPDSEALATARNDFADTTVGAPGTPTLKPIAAPTNASDGGDCTLRQQSATMLTEDVCLKSQTIGSESCPECPSSCDSFGSGSEFPLETGKFYIFEINRQEYLQRNGIWFNLVNLQSPNSYMSLYKGTFCDGLTCIASRDGGGCPGMQERELDDGLYVLFIHGAEDDATFDLEFTFTSFGSPYPSVCSV